MADLTVDPERDLLFPRTGIYVRARKGNEWVHADIATLGRDSLLTWLRSRGGKNIWAENTVGLLLGYGTLTEE